MRFLLFYFIFAKIRYTKNEISKPEKYWFYFIRKEQKQNSDDLQADKAALALYENTFNTTTKRKLIKPKPFIKGGTYDITKKTTDTKGSGSIYLPSNKRLEEAMKKKKV